MAKVRNIRADITQRSWIIATFIFFVAIVVACKIVYVQKLQTYKGKPWQKYLTQTIHPDTVRAMRGNIYSSNGSLLVTSLPYYTMSLDPTIADSIYFPTRVDSLCNNLARFFGEKSSEQYRRQIVFARKNKDRDVRLVSKPLTLKQSEIVRRWPFFRKLKNSNSTKGGKLALFYKRYKPFGNLASHTIGAVDVEKPFGIEIRFQKELAGTPSIGYMAVLDDGTRMPMEDEATTQPVSGYDVHTTIDVNFQDIAETALKRTLQKYDATFGTAVVMEVNTGAIKAMANLGKSKNDTGYVDNRNYAVAYRANPGSTFKAATMLAVLEEGRLTPSNKIETGTSGFLKYHGIEIEDTHPHNTLTVSQVLEVSSNIGVHKLMQASGFYQNQQRYVDYMQRFGLRNRTNIDLLGEALPVVHGPQKTRSEGGLWNRPTSPTYVSYGYEWEFSPLQILSFYNAVANNGIWVKPRLVTKITKPNNELQRFEVEQKSTRFCSEKSLNHLRTMLEGVVRNGTAQNLKDAHYQIAGKTGTAQIYGPGGYKSGRYNVSFVGYFPAKNPKYSCIVWVHYPKGRSEGELFAASVAAPVFKEISDRIVGYDVNMHPALPQNKNNVNNVVKQFRKGNADDLRAIAEGLNTDAIPTIDGWVESKNGKKWKSQDIDTLSLTGMSLRDALYMLENKGYKVVARGRGKVQKAEKQGRQYLLTLR